MFDERFFLNYEETDLCNRARKLGISCFIIPSSLVRHHAHATLGPYRAPMQLYFLTRNALLFTEKHGSARERWETLKSRLTAFYWNVRRSWEAGFILDLPTRGMLRGLWDYGWRRFGDCPPAIRRLDAAYRGLAYVPSSFACRA